MVIPCNFPDIVCPNSHSGRNVNQSQCDVKCIVGPDGDTWTIAVRRRDLMRNEILATLLRDSESAIRIPDVDKRGFEYLLREIEGVEIEFPSVSTARTTLDVAYKYQSSRLVNKCIEYIDLHLDENNVLNVYKNLQEYCNNSHNFEPSAPVYEASTPSHAATSIQTKCSDLLYNCLLFIDEHLSEIANREEFEFLNLKDISTIISRDTLQVNNELILFDCLMRWLRCECMRLGNKPVNANTRQEIMGNLIYKIRFVLMSRHDFLTGPAASGIFTPNEINEILVVIDKCSDISCKKRIKNRDIPKPLSMRTQLRCNQSKLKKKKDKNKALLNCLTVWTVLFD